MVKFVVPCSNSNRNTNNATKISRILLKALEKIQNLDTNEKTVQVFTDSRITLDALKNRRNHAHLIEQIRTSVMELENQNWNIDFHWVKAHAGHHGNELADNSRKRLRLALKMRPTGKYRKAQ